MPFWNPFRTPVPQQRPANVSSQQRLNKIRALANTLRNNVNNQTKQSVISKMRAEYLQMERNTGPNRERLLQSARNIISKY